MEAWAFYEITLIIGLATIFGLIGLLLRQPLIVSFIAAGIIAATDALNVIHSGQIIKFLSQISIAVLLFLVGLKLDLKLINSIGKVAVATGLGQVIFTAIIGFFICLLLDMDWITSLYISTSLTFSSTIIIVKLLTDKGEIDSLHGRIALGFLIVQDLFVIIVMIMVSAFGVGIGNGSANIIQDLYFLAGGFISMLTFFFLFIRYFAGPLTAFVSRSSELLVIFSVAWASAFAALSDFFGLGKELGGLIAGVSLASTPVRDIIGARLSSLRDFLLLFFFIVLGNTIDIFKIGEQITPSLFLSLFVLIGNPIIVMAIMGYMGYRKRTGFLAGLTVAQISEFSLIFMAMGVSNGHVSQDALGLVTLVGFFTIFVSVYMITYSHKLYDWCEPFIGLFERKHPFRETYEDTPGADHRGHDVIILGLGRFGSRIGYGLSLVGYRVLGVDFNPEELANWRKKGMDAIFGDASDPEVLSHLPLSGVKAVISTIPNSPGPLTESDCHMITIVTLRNLGFKGIIAIRVNGDEMDSAYLAKGATLLLSPFEDASQTAIDRLMDLMGKEKTV